MAGRMRRVILAGGAVILALAVATACAPEPAPSPSPTGFTSEEEAFAAAEETLRDYVAATNGVVIDQPTTFEPVFALTTGDQNAFDRKRLSQYHASRYRTVGATEVVTVTPAAWQPRTHEARLLACLDVSEVDVIDGTGQSIVSPDRPLRQSLEFVFSEENATFLIKSITGAEAIGPCAP